MKFAKIDIILFYYTRKDKREDFTSNDAYNLSQLSRLNKRDRRDVNE